MKRFSVLFIAVMGLGLLVPASAQTIFNCSGFASSGTCGVNVWYQHNTPFSWNNGALAAISGSQIVMIPVGSNGGGHNSTNVTYQTAVNVQAFTSTFTFVPNGKNIAFVVQNNTSAAGDYVAGPGSNFNAGAGCEAGFFQAFTGGPPLVNNIFAMELDQFSPLLNTAPWPYTFTYSSAMIYQAEQSPCIPAYNGTFGYQFAPSKVSTSPVNLNVARTGTVNVSGTSVTWVSGNTFNTNWVNGTQITLGSVTDYISSVSSPTSLTMQEPTGERNGSDLQPVTIDHNRRHLLCHGRLRRLELFDVHVRRYPG